MKKMKKCILILILLIVGFSSILGQTNSSIVQKNKEDIILLNEKNIRIDDKISCVSEKVLNLKVYTDALIESQNKMINLIVTLLFVLVAAMVTLIGYIIYDRNTAMRPIQQNIQRLDRRNEMIITTIQNIITKDNRLFTILQSLRNYNDIQNDGEYELYSQEIEDLLHSPIFQLQNNQEDV